jgi:hypothetical protein
MANPSFDDEAVFVPSRVFDDPVEAADTTSLDDVDEKPGTVDWLDEI